jgi:hypothetical protein
MRLRTFLRVFSSAVISLGTIAAVISLLDFRNAASIFGASIGTILLAGLLWMLTEISEQLAELPEDLAAFKAERTSAASDAAPPQPLQRRA